MLLEEFVGHGTSVTCLSLGQKSGHVMATGGEDKKVNLWAIGKPNCILSLNGHTNKIQCVKFGHNEDLVCAGSASGSLKVWDLNAAKILRSLTGHKLVINCLDFHPYGDFVASGSLDSNIKLWDIRKKGCMFTYKGHVKDITCLKFSPDGRWLASGGDDGSVKLWDLPAGKVLAELIGHTGTVSDVCFHPNEFLLSSSSTDGTVKFWDLESFTLVSSTVNDSGAIKKIIYHPDGGALFSGARDVLKVYGWEPARVYDTLVMNWGKVSDIAVSENQLIAGSFSMTNVSVYVVDLSKVQPFSQTVPQIKSVFTRNLDSSIRQSTRKNYYDNGSVSHSQLESLESSKSEETMTSDETCDESLQVIDTIKDPKVIFAPRSELCRTPPKFTPLTEFSNDISTDSTYHRLSAPNLSLAPLTHQPSATTNITNNNTSTIKSRYSTGLRSSESYSNMGNTTNETILPSISNSAINSKMNISKTGGSLPVIPQIREANQTNNITNTIKQPVISKTVTLTNSNTSVTAKISTTVPLVPLNTDNHSKQKSTNIVHPRPSEMVSVVRPVIKDVKSPTSGTKVHPLATTNNSRRKETTFSNMPRAAVVFPEQQKKEEITAPLCKSPDSPTELIPEARNHPAGLDVDEFLPKHLQMSVRLGYSIQPEMSESEAMQSIVRGHKSFVTALSHRKKHLQIILALWSTKDSRTALEQAFQLEDQSVLVDIINVIVLKPAIWTLDMCQLLLPVTYELLRSKYESYMSAGCEALKLVLKNFATIIKTNITAPPGVGVDISREERYNKCMSCYNQLLSVRAFILKKQTLQGKLGRSFRELSILMQNLE